MLAGALKMVGGLSRRCFRSAAPPTFFLREANQSWSRSSTQLFSVRSIIDVKASGWLVIKWHKYILSGWLMRLIIIYMTTCCASSCRVI
ncbi:UPF0481 protein-like [Iris pallida]|uniref:UPF0481 protein-like n=1 Tax=Iris pallida TaxID=29817 RepID=A0AAX6EKW5_IRIPA|nr:UPF0481 protein-like [Iris pallida]